MKSNLTAYLHYEHLYINKILNIKMFKLFILWGKDNRGGWDLSWSPQTFFREAWYLEEILR
jgi:hypothetical protein